MIGRVHSTDMLQRSVLIAILSLLPGCVNALRPYNEPSRETLWVISSTPSSYRVKINNHTTVPVPRDGRVAFDVPRLTRGCATYFLGIKVKDASPYDLPAIEIIEGERTVKRLSLNDIRKLPRDEQGYTVVKIE